MRRDATSLQTLIDLLYVIKKFVAPLSSVAAGYEIGRQFFPLLLQGVYKSFHILFELATLRFVGFGKDDAERHTVFAKEAYKLKVYFLWFKTRVYQHKQAGELLALKYIIVDEFFEFIYLVTSTFGIAITRKVDKVPLIVYNKVVDEHGLAWR